MNGSSSTNVKLIGLDTETGGTRPNCGIRSLYAISISYSDFWRRAETRQLTQSQFGEVYDIFGTQNPDIKFGYGQLLCRLRPTDVDATGAILTHRLTPSALMASHVLTRHQVMIDYRDWHFGQGRSISVGHNVRAFDIPFIKHAMVCESLLPPDLFRLRGTDQHVDTLLLARAAHHLDPQKYTWVLQDSPQGQRRVSMKLGHIAAANGFPLGEHAHDAAFDTLATMPMLGMFASRSPALLRSFEHNSNPWNLLRDFTNPAHSLFYVAGLSHQGVDAKIVSPLAVCRRGNTPKAFLTFVHGEDADGDLKKLGSITPEEWLDITRQIKTERSADLRSIEKKYPFLHIILAKKTGLCLNLSDQDDVVLPNNPDFSKIENQAEALKRQLKVSGLPTKIHQGFQSALAEPEATDDSKAGTHFAEWADPDYGHLLRDARTRFHAAPTWEEAAEICDNLDRDGHRWMPVLHQAMLNIIGDHAPQILAREQPVLWQQYAAHVRTSLSTDDGHKPSVAASLADIRTRLAAPIANEDRHLLNEWASYFEVTERFWMRRDVPPPDVFHEKAVLHLARG